MTHPIDRRHLGKLLVAGSVGAVLGTRLSAAAQDGAVLRMGLNASDLQTLDPHMASGSQDRATVDMIFNGLVRFVPGTSDQFEADLAEDMPTAALNDDGTQSWTFTLKDGVRIHSTEGNEPADLTVDDVVFSFEKASSEETSLYAGDYDGWSFAAGEGARAFIVTVPVPISEELFLPKVANYSGGYIVPKSGYDAVGADGFLTNPIGTGPFAFSVHEPQNRVELVAHADYFRGEPALSGVNVLYLPDTTARELALQAGDVDVIYGQNESTWAERIDQLDGITTDIFGVADVIFISLNVEHEILQDVKVREAIIKAIDRGNHLALAGEPVAQPVFSIVPAALMPGGLTEEEADAAEVNYQQDIEGAKALLAEAGYPDGFTLSMVSSEQLQYRQSYEVLQEELRQVGITVELEIVQHATMHELIREGRNPITLYVAFRPSADTYLTQFFSTEGDVTNFSRFTVDDLRDEARAETDGDRQAELWREANIEILKNFAGYGLYFANQVFARADNVDYGHQLTAMVQLYPGIDETTTVGDS